MRFTAFVFSIYIFALALMPCSDNADHSHNGDNQIAITQTHSDTAEHHADMCSPFCLCQCCQTSVVELSLPFIPTAPAMFESAQSSYNRNFQSGFSNIFLPPPMA